MRIVGGIWRGRTLIAPPGQTTRPTSERLRQALFDMLLHAPWGGRGLVEGAHVLDAFAGTGGLGLEALSRGAARATFLERDRAALAVLRANVAACGAEAARVIAGDATRPPPLAASIGEPATLVFLDPPYGLGLVEAAVTALRRAGWIGSGAIVAAEIGRAEPAPSIGEILVERAHGAGRIVVARVPAAFAASPGGEPTVV